MATKVQVTGGILEVEAIMGPTQPDAGLPITPARPGQLPSSDLHPWVPGHLPEPGPPGVFPPLTPSHPIQPAPPGTPPGAIWPPVGHPSHPIAGTPGHPSQGLPTPPSGTLPTRPPVAPGHDLPPGQGGVVTPPIASKTYWLIAGVPGVGWRYVAIDPSLVVGMPLPPAAAPKSA
jgi:hypothetical protein